MEVKLAALRKLCRSKELKVSYNSLVVFDQNGNDIFNMQPGADGQRAFVSDTELGVLNALLGDSTIQTFHLKIFSDSFVCFLSTGGILIGRGCFNEGRETTTTISGSDVEFKTSCDEVLEKKHNRDTETNTNALNKTCLRPDQQTCKCCENKKTDGCENAFCERAVNRQETGEGGLFIAGKVGGSTVILRGPCQIEMSLLGMFKAVKDILTA